MDINEPACENMFAHRPLSILTVEEKGLTELCRMLTLKFKILWEIV